MTRIRVKTIIWDQWNTEHIKKHGVLIHEVEEAGKNIIYHRKTEKNRFLAVGMSGNRMITLIIRRLESTRYFLVTARDASKKERKIVYEKEK